MHLSSTRCSASKLHSSAAQIRRVCKLHIQIPYAIIQIPYAIIQIPYSIIQIPYSIIQIPYAIIPQIHAHNHRERESARARAREREREEERETTVDKADTVVRFEEEFKGSRLRVEA